MWVFPLAAAAVSLVFTGQLWARFRMAGRPYLALWTIALAMYGLASLALTLGAFNGWSEAEFWIYWAFGAVLNVPFLAGGEIVLLVRARAALWIVSVALALVTVYTFAVLAGASFDAVSLAEQLPSGKHLFGDGSDAHRLPQLISIPSYLILVGGTLWSAWTMRGHLELRDRFWGTLLVALGATVTAAAGSAFAALGYLVAFSAALTAGVSLMFWGFVRASRTAAPAAASTAPPR